MELPEHMMRLSSIGQRVFTQSRKDSSRFIV